MKEKITNFKSDAEAEAFVDTADLIEYDFSQFNPLRFEFQAKTERVNMRLPTELYQIPPITSPAPRPSFRNPGAKRIGYPEPSTRCLAFRPVRRIGRALRAHFALGSGSALRKGSA